MIGLDTNVIVCYVAQDDPKQSPKATLLIESLSADAPGFISIVSVVELVWVLMGCYSLSRDEICEVLETLLRSKELVVANADIIWKALRLFKEGNADFADCLIERFANEEGCRYTATFDREAVKHCHMKLID
ncbi:MAG: type II toxin-antitoxin system VapC family toxin [Nitrosomonadales bacterium]|nr:type II toxin-antitoxin system VapC family toxin [Nitrosomonadales bacterium]